MATCLPPAVWRGRGHGRLCHQPSGAAGRNPCAHIAPKPGWYNAPAHDRPAIQPRGAPTPTDAAHRPTLDDAREALRAHFGYPDFRPGQEEVISAVLSGQDCLAVMPTGAGKSVCYQVPAAVLGGLTIVVSPLISLMGDQVRALKQAGIRGSYLNSSLNPRQQQIVLQRALGGWYDLMYVAPERLRDPRFCAFAAQAHVPLLAVDEAHCVSQWGQDFRPAYQDIAGFAEGLPGRPPVVALTATATARVRQDVVSLLRLRQPHVVVSGFDRPNLRLASFELTPKQRRQWVASYVRRHAGQSGIVYGTTRRAVDELAEALQDEGLSAVAYHAGYDTATRAEAQERWVRDDVQVMVATNAFGMGIDKSDVRFVINCGLPQSVEEYYQEAGRAGRDGEPAECYLLWSRGDIRTCHFLIENTEWGEGVSPQEAALLQERRERLLGAMIGYAMSTSCLRRRILSYFGQDQAVSATCDCSVCAHETPDRYLRPARRTTFGAGGRARPDVATDADDRPAGADEELFQRLCALRKRLADEQGVPPYVVFSDATLRGMVRRRPRTEEDLLSVSGVGQVKLERYGVAFLAELRGE